VTDVVLEPWLDKRGLARHLACGVRTIERALTQGMPHTVMYGKVKFRASEVEAWLERTGQLERRGLVILDGHNQMARQRANADGPE